jgi:hypothetical protein
MQQQARATGEAFNPFNAAQELVKSESAQLVVKQNENKQQRLEKRFTEKKVVYDRSRTYTIEDLKLLGFNDAEAATIKRIQDGK